MTIARFSQFRYAVCQIDAVRTILFCSKVEPRCTILQTRSLTPVIGSHDTTPTFNRTKFFLTYVVGPTTTVNAFCTTEHDKVQNSAVNNIGMVPVVDTTAHDNHGTTFRFFSIICKFTCCSNSNVRFYASDFFLPCRCVWSVISIACSHFTTDTTVNTVVSKNEVIHCSYFHRTICSLYRNSRNSTFNNTFVLFITKVRQFNNRHIFPLIKHG